MRTTKPKNKKAQKNTALVYEGGQPGGRQFRVKEVFRGEMKPGDEATIRTGLIDGQVFVPQVAGIRPASEGLQRVGHRFIGLEVTEERSTDPRSISELVRSLAAMKEDLPKFQAATKARPVFRTR